MMTWAWMVFACIGVFMPRQFKEVTADIKTGGIALWFQVCNIEFYPCSHERWFLCGSLCLEWFIY